MTIPADPGEIPFVTAEQMKEVDRLMIEEYRISLIQMMENAGRNLASLARSRFFLGDSQDKVAVVLAGTGGNGGGALVCARHLSNYGFRVSVFISKPAENFKGVPARQLEILRKMGTEIGLSDALTDHTGPMDLIVDGLIGYSLEGAPRDAAADMIRWANEQAAPILALDIPSGVDSTSGTVYVPAIKAAATMTLALPKEGFRAAGTSAHVGELYLADISVPPALYNRIGLQVKPGFFQGEILRLR